MNEQVNNEVTQADLEEWYRLKEQLDDTKTKEFALRKKIYAHYFVARDEHGVEIQPKEGTNNFELPDGFVLKAQRVINRSVDQGSLAALKQEKIELSEKEDLTHEERARLELLLALPLDDLVRYKPELETREYRKLSDEARNVFDTALVIKDGTPQLDIVKPKRAR